MIKKHVMKEISGVRKRHELVSKGQLPESINRLRFVGVADAMWRIGLEFLGIRGMSVLEQYKVPNPVLIGVVKEVYHGRD